LITEQETLMQLDLSDDDVELLRPESASRR